MMSALKHNAIDFHTWSGVQNISVQSLSFQKPHNHQWWRNWISLRLPEMSSHLSESLQWWLWQWNKPLQNSCQVMKPEPLHCLSLCVKNVFWQESSISSTRSWWYMRFFNTIYSIKFLKFLQSNYLAKVDWNALDWFFQTSVKTGNIQHHQLCSSTTFKFKSGKIFENSTTKFLVYFCNPLI